MVLQLLQSSYTALAPLHTCSISAALSHRLTTHMQCPYPPLSLHLSGPPAHWPSTLPTCCVASVGPGDICRLIESALLTLLTPEGRAMTKVRLHALGSFRHIQDLCVMTSLGKLKAAKRTVQHLLPVCKPGVLCCVVTAAHYECTAGPCLTAMSHTSMQCLTLSFQCIAHLGHQQL